MSDVKQFIGRGLPRKYTSDDYRRAYAIAVGQAQKQQSTSARRPIRYTEFSDEEYYEHLACQRGEVTGLVKSHITDRVSLSYLEFLRKLGIRGLKEAQVMVFADCLQIRVPGGMVGSNSGGGPRGKVFGMSAASRRRMLNRLACVRNLEKAWFLTLTYPDEFPHDWKRWKRDLKVLLQRLKRRAERAGYSIAGIWRLELVPRKSGVNQGAIAPHFHLLVLGLEQVENILLFRQWLSEMWYDVVGSHDERHLYAGTQCKRVESRAHAMRYVSKYIAKQQSDGGALAELCRLRTGRVWGSFGELDTSPSEVLVLPAEVTPALRRLLAQYLTARGRDRFARFVQQSKLGCTVLGLGDSSLHFLEPVRTTLPRWLRGEPPINLRDDHERKAFGEDPPWRPTVMRMISAAWEATYA